MYFHVFYNLQVMIIIVFIFLFPFFTISTFIATLFPSLIPSLPPGLFPSTFPHSISSSLRVGPRRGMCRRRLVVFGGNSCSQLWMTTHLAPWRREKQIEERKMKWGREGGRHNLFGGPCLLPALLTPYPNSTGQDRAVRMSKGGRRRDGREGR